MESNIYYIPKMDDESYRLAYAGPAGRRAAGEWINEKQAPEVYHRWVQEQLLKGEGLYSIRRRPGILLGGATLWTYDWTGYS